ncbi:MAG TPA: hypothetical protein VGF84_04415, partial [Micromonosporaceae bacterium]
IEVRSRVPGLDTFGVPNVLVDLPGPVATLRSLIAAAVRAQVAALRVDMARARSALDRQYLSEADIRAQAATGAIRMPEIPADVDPAVEIERAYAAFAAGVFVVFVGGAQVTDLDADVPIGSGDRITFLRLTALQGG